MCKEQVLDLKFGKVGQRDIKMRNNDGVNKSRSEKLSDRTYILQGDERRGACLILREEDPVLERRLKDN